MKDGWIPFSCSSFWYSCYCACWFTVTLSWPTGTPEKILVNVVRNTSSFPLRQFKMSAGSHSDKLVWFWSRVSEAAGRKEASSHVTVDVCDWRRVTLSLCLVMLQLALLSLPVLVVVARLSRRPFYYRKWDRSWFVSFFVFFLKPQRDRKLSSPRPRRKWPLGLFSLSSDVLQRAAAHRALLLLLLLLLSDQLWMKSWMLLFKIATKLQKYKVRASWWLERRPYDAWFDSKTNAGWSQSLVGGKEVVL